MSSGKRGPIGAQRPRIDHAPPHKHTTGPEAIALAASAGLVLDDWQQYILSASLGETEGGEWSARKIGLMVSRQNGKGALLEARELAGLFLLEEPLIVHTAHLQDTANSHFRRLVGRIKDTPHLAARLAKPGGILRGHGTESINLAPNPDTGVAPRLEVRTRTGSGGLGFSISCLIFDEAMIISDAMHQALLPTLSAMPNMQSWYTGSAVDEDNPSHQGVPFARIREQGLREDPGMAYFEWSLDMAPEDVVLDRITDEDLFATNPGAGIRLDLPYIREDEMPGLGAVGTAIQRLGVGRWPRTDGLANAPITPEAWDLCVDLKSAPLAPVVFAFDVPPNRSSATIAVAGWRKDGKAHVEMVEKRKGKDWLPARLAELKAKHKPAAVVTDAVGPAGTLIPDLEKLKVPVTPINSHEHAQACGLIFDFVDEQKLCHLDEPELKVAIQNADTRPLSDAWAWSRKNSAGEISPLVAVTFALWGVQTIRPRRTVIGSLEDFLEDTDANDP